MKKILVYSFFCLIAIFAGFSLCQLWQWRQLTTEECVRRGGRVMTRLDEPCPTHKCLGEVIDEVCPCLCCRQ